MQHHGESKSILHAGPKVLCNACGLKKHTLRAIHGTPDGKPVRSPAGTPCQQLPPMPMAALPPATPDCKRSRAAIAAAGPAEARTPTRRSQAAANDAPPWTEGCVVWCFGLAVPTQGYCQLDIVRIAAVALIRCSHEVKLA